MKGVRVFYKAWFPKAYDPDKESANRELLGMIVCNLEKNHTYDIKMLRGGVMKISIPHEFGQLTLRLCNWRSQENRPGSSGDQVHERYHGRSTLRPGDLCEEMGQNDASNRDPEKWHKDAVARCALRL